MKFSYLCLILPLIFTACGDSSMDHSEHSPKPSEGSAAGPTNPISVVDGVTIVKMTGNDRMKFNLESFTVPAAGQVKLIFTNVGKMPKAAMGHNVVFLTAEADANVLATAASSARDNDYIPTNLEDQILAYTKILGPGESDTIEFTAPEVPGEYEFLCSFPAHLFAGMRGVMTVE